MSRRIQKPFLNKYDIMILAVLTLTGIAITVWIYFPHQSNATHLEVRQNGSVILSLPLDTETEQTITTENGGTNRFRIQNQSVIMLEADCGDHTCIRTGRISHTGESIVCLPHRLTLQITAKDSPSQDQVPDAVVH